MKKKKKKTEKQPKISFMDRNRREENDSIYLKLKERKMPGGFFSRSIKN